MANRDDREKGQGGNSGGSSGGSKKSGKGGGRSGQGGSSAAVGVLPADRVAAAAAPKFALRRGTLCESAGWCFASVSCRVLSGLPSLVVFPAFCP